MSHILTEKKKVGHPEKNVKKPKFSPVSKNHEDPP
jgi:hypothetical protein